MKNQVLDAISARRSIRAYTQDQITGEQLDALMAAALAAPSANNAQPWHFSVVQDGELLSRVNEAFRKVAISSFPEDQRTRFEDPAYSVFFHAPTVIFISSASMEARRFAEIDSGIAVQTLALAAQSMGLGSVILGLPRMAFMDDDAASLRTALQFPEDYDFCIAIAIGNPATTKDPHPVEPNRVTIIR